MTDGLVPEGDGHTPLDPDDLAGLIPTWIATRGDLNEAETRNIAKAQRRRPPTIDQLLDDLYLRELHVAMFGEVWRWAGAYRRTETTIGIDPAEIAVAVRQLVEDVRVWIAADGYPADEAAARFHHRLVAIHPFPNGNGRHGRAAADYCARGLGHPPFTWGSGLGLSTTDLRRAYRDALVAADKGDDNPLLAFVRS